MRHASDRIKKIGVARFFWSGQCTEDVEFKIYISKDTALSSSYRKSSWNLLNLPCREEESEEVTMTLTEDSNSMLAARSVFGTAKLVGEMVNLKSVPHKSPRRFVPKVCNFR